MISVIKNNNNKSDYINILKENNQEIVNLVIYNIEEIKRPYKVINTKYNTQILYGETISDLVDDKMYSILEEAYQDNTLTKTNKTYTINNHKYNEYILNSKKYIRINKDKIYWFNIDNIIWDLIENEKSTKLISKNTFINDDIDILENNIKLENDKHLTF